MSNVSVVFSLRNVNRAFGEPMVPDDLGLSPHSVPAVEDNVPEPPRPPVLNLLILPGTQSGQVLRVRKGFESGDTQNFTGNDLLSSDAREAASRN